MNETLLAADLLAHRGFLRALARSLVGEDRADDLVQDTYVAALEHPPQGVRSIRGWLAGVLRHRVARDRRQSLARGDREQRAALSRAIEVETTALLDLGRDVVEAVRALDEPYRSAIVLRYHEGLSPTRISRRLELPLATVNSRLSRARGMLRERLDQSHGGRSRWERGLLALAHRSVEFSVPVVIPIALIALATAFLLVSSLGLLGPRRIESQGATAVAPLANQDPPADGQTRIVGQVRVPPGVQLSTVRVQVLDLAKASDPRARARAGILGESLLDAEGRFELEVRGGVRVAVVVDSPDTASFDAIDTTPVGETWDLGVVALDEGAVVAGRVRRGPGKPLTGLIVFVRDDARLEGDGEVISMRPTWFEGRIVQTGFEAELDQGGRFRVAGLEAGILYEVDVIPAVARQEAWSGPSSWASPRQMTEKVLAPRTGLEFEVPTRTVSLAPTLAGARVPCALGRQDRYPMRWRSVVMVDGGHTDGFSEGGLTLPLGAPTQLVLDPTKRHKYQLTAPGCLPFALVIEAGEGDLVLAPDLEHDGPLPLLEIVLPGLADGTRVAIEISDGRAREDIRREAFVQDGRVSIDDLFAGSLFVRIAPIVDPGDVNTWRVPVEKSISLVSGETSEIQAECPPGGRLIVTLTDDHLPGQLWVRDGSDRVIYPRGRHSRGDPRSQDLVLPAGMYRVSIGQGPTTFAEVKTGEVTSVRILP